MRRFHLKIPIFIPEFMYQPAVRIVLIYRRFRYGYTFRKIPLTQGKYTIVDVEEYEHLNEFKWCATKKGRTFYAIRNERKNKRPYSVFMHRQLMNLPPDKSIDHINHNGLDNRRANLRIVSQEQNIWNKRKQAGNCDSKYKGIWKKEGKWQAGIAHKGRRYFLGSFDDEQAAARAYDAKAKELFGEYACLNFQD